MSDSRHVGPKYSTWTVAMTSKPKILHSTFLILTACLLSQALHEQPLLEREREGVTYFSRSLSGRASIRPYPLLSTSCHTSASTSSCLPSLLLRVTLLPTPPVRLPPRISFISFIPVYTTHFWLPLMPLCSQLFYGAFCLQCLCVPLDSRCTSPFPVCVSRNSCRAFPHIRYKFMTDCLLAVVTTFETIDQSHIVFWCLWTVVVQHWVGSATCVAF